MDQIVFNIVVGVAGVLGGWWLKAIWDAIKELKVADDKLTMQVSDLRVLVAGQYASKESFNQLSNAIFKKLDRIEDKLDNKVDKI